MNVAVVGSSDLMTTSEVVQTIEGIIDKLKDVDGALFVRKDLGGRYASMVEAAASVMATVSDVPVTYFVPMSGGRAEVYHRDYRLVEEADQVFAFFSEGHALEGGTGHVVHAAMQKRVAVLAWEVGTQTLHLLVNSDGDE